MDRLVPNIGEVELMFLQYEGGMSEINSTDRSIREVRLAGAASLGGSSTCLWDEFDAPDLHTVRPPLRDHYQSKER